MSTDLRQADDAEFWEGFEKVMGPDGLLTYRYLGTRTVEGADGHPEGSLRIRHDLRNGGGGLLAAPLSIAIADLGGTSSDATGVPAPVQSSVSILDSGRDVGEIRVRGVTLRNGKSMGFGQSEIRDAANPARVIAITRGIWVNLRAAPPGYRYVDPGPGIEDSPLLPPLPEAFGAKHFDLGVWELPELNAHLGSTTGSLHHGPTQIVLEGAALDLAEEVTNTGHAQIEDWSVMYVARGTTGPFRTAGQITCGHDRISCRVVLRDSGNGDRLVASAVGVFGETG
ncbi:MAG: hypothetical protein WB785_20955 [Mycobacterium sp.]|uniref:PaaI family thioesterase n=1 Tax=Mycobacterium sp. TaxID=1785 RepID=UPI003C61BF98